MKSLLLLAAALAVAMPLMAETEEVGGGRQHEYGGGISVGCRTAFRESPDD